ncbi:MAG: NLP/P60 hydrolase, partial [Cognatishimia sp.]
PADAPLERNDLLFWKGHVALVADEGRLIHANAHHMAVTYEGVDAAINRINAQGDGPVTSRKRVVLPA